MDPLPDPRSLADEELKSLIEELIRKEQEVSETRRVLRAQIDALRRELVDRLREEGQDIIFGPDVLGPGSASVREPRSPRPQRGSDGVALPEPPDSDTDSAPPWLEPRDGQ
jgi:RsiG-like